MLSYVRSCLFIMMILQQAANAASIFNDTAANEHEKLKNQITLIAEQYCCQQTAIQAHATCRVAQF